MRGRGFFSGERRRARDDRVYRLCCGASPTLVCRPDDPLPLITDAIWSAPGDVRRVLVALDSVDTAADLLRMVESFAARRGATIDLVGFIPRRGDPTGALCSGLVPAVPVLPRSPDAVENGLRDLCARSLPDVSIHRRVVAGPLRTKLREVVSAGFYDLIVIRT